MKSALATIFALFCATAHAQTPLCTDLSRAIEDAMKSSSLEAALTRSGGSATGVNNKVLVLATTINTNMMLMGQLKCEPIKVVVHHDAYNDDAEACVAAMKLDNERVKQFCPAAKWTNTNPSGREFGVKRGM